MPAATLNIRVSTNEDFRRTWTADVDLSAATATMTIKDSDGVQQSQHNPAIVGGASSTISPEILAASQLSAGTYDWDLLITNYPTAGDSEQWLAGKYTVVTGQT